jgi:purine-nucleoside phosphorylase
MNAAAQHIRRVAPDARPRIAVLLGSGWARFTRHLAEPVQIPYAALQGFPPPGVAGHSGELWLGKLGGRDVAVLSGRRHVYEDGSCDAMKLPLQTMRELGVRVLVQTNAAGSLDAALWPGRLMMISDHLNIAQRSPLVGQGGSERFVDMIDAYDPQLRRAAREAALRIGTHLDEGVFAWVLGPQFETPAEIRMLQRLGATAVGMSTVPETIIARHSSMRVLAISLITNMAAGLSDERLSHAHTLAQAEAAAATACGLLAEIVRAIDA